MKEEWKNRVEEQRQSGQSISAWCRQEGLSKDQFYYWRKRLSDEGGAVTEGSFVRIDKVEPVELVLGGKVSLRIPANFDGVSLKRLLEVLGC